MENDDKVPEVLEYRASAKKLYKIAFYTILLVELIIVRVKLPEIWNEEWYWGLGQILLASGVAITILVRLFFFVRPRLFAQYKIYDHLLEIEFKRKKKEIYFDQIQDIQISKLSPRFFGGFYIFLKSGQRFIFLSLLHKNDEILKKILENRPEFKDKVNWEKFLQTCQLVEISWQRLGRKLKFWPFALLKYLILPVGLASVLYYAYQDKLGSYGDFLARWGILLFVISACLGLVFNHFEERTLNGRMLKQQETSGVLQREIDFEKMVSWMLNGVHFLALCLMSALISSLM